jgi:phosphatidate cytidylyltransferase
MLKRILTALVIAPAAMIMMALGGVPLLVIVLLTSFLTAQEIYVMLAQNGYSPNTFVGYLLISGIIFSAFAHETRPLWDTMGMKALVVVVLGGAVVEIWRKKVWFSHNSWLATLRVAVFVGVTFSFYIVLRSGTHGLRNVLFCTMMTWLADIGALVGGRYFGNHPLSDISPKKTVEGSATSILTCIVFSFVLIWLLGLTWHYVFLGVVISIVGQIGDLHESLTKRAFKVKDSSSLLPGHGGIYDRGDSAMFTLPVSYYLIN